jgi:hypothetical protein
MMFETGRGKDRARKITALANDAISFEALGVP